MACDNCGRPKTEHDDGSAYRAAKGWGDGCSGYQEAVIESGWLLESWNPILQSSERRWLTFKDGWLLTEDSNEAIRFSRCQDAEKVCRAVFHQCMNWVLRPTEHQWS